jgi:hypothetical protein
VAIAGGVWWLLVTALRALCFRPGWGQGPWPTPARELPWAESTLAAGPQETLRGQVVRRTAIADGPIGQKGPVRQGGRSVALPIEGRLFTRAVTAQCAFLSHGVGPLEDPVLPG